MKQAWLYVARILLLAGVYSVVAYFSLMLAFEDTNASPVWPPSGFAFSMLLCLGSRHWPAVFLGAFAANLLTFSQAQVALPSAISMSLLIGAGNTLEALLGTFLFRRFKGSEIRFRSVWNVFVLVFSIGLSCALAAFIGITTLYGFGQIPGALMASIFLTWWIGDLVGILVVSPLCCETYCRMPRLLPDKHRMEWFAILALLFFLCTFVFGGLTQRGLTQSMPYLVIPVLLWCAYRFEFLETAIANFIVCAFAVWHTTHGSGPLSAVDFNDALIMLQIFIGVISVTCLAIVAAFSERFQAVAAVKSLNADLEDRIRERTVELQASKMESEKLAAQAQQANFAKTMFLASMSHEIRTPLNGILGFTTVLEEGNPKPDQLEAVQQIRESGNHLLGLVEGVLRLAELESGNLQLKVVPCSIHALLRECYQSAEKEIEVQGLGFEIELEEGIPERLYMDELCVKQIVNHLLENAIKFTSSGAVKIKCYYDAKPAGQGVCHVEVCDTGIGIQADKLEQIFGAFTQADQSIHGRFGGTGLGLAVCRRLAEFLGGDIKAESEYGEGSCFTLSLPVSVAQQVVVRAEDCEGQARDKQAQLNILVAEDNAVNRRVAKHLLQKRGHRVTFAVNGREAIEMLGDGAFDVILMDIQMPEMDGIEATRRIREGEAGEPKKSIPIVALTAYTREEDQAKFRNCGMDSYLSKPIKIPELEKTLATCCTQQSKA